MKDQKNSRRAFLKGAAYVAPAVVTLKAVPSFANTGSTRPTSEPGFIDWGTGCSSSDLGVGDEEITRDRYNICP